MFLPCFADLLYPQVGRAMLSLFARIGIPLSYPVDQTCCGQPAFNSGYLTEAKSTARHFSDVFRDYDFIVVPSGSCAAMARVFFGHMGSDANTVSVGTRVYELSEFLTQIAGVIDVGARFPHKVTYHDGCHARRELRSSDAAMLLLRNVRDIDFIELPAVEECCGFGGAFSVKFAALSTSMGEAKCSAVRLTRADVLVSGDSSCLMHIGGMLAQQGGNPVRTMHLCEVLAST